MIKVAGEFYHEYTKDMVRSYIWSRNETQPFGGFIWIFVYVLAAQTSAGQASSKFVSRIYERSVSLTINLKDICWICIIPFVIQIYLQDLRMKFLDKLPEYECMILFGNSRL